jgi:hypothetical protein
MKLALEFEALFESAGLAFGCGVSPGVFFTAKTQIHEVIQHEFVLKTNFSSTFYVVNRL